jgi:hypothetical protein
MPNPLVDKVVEPNNMLDTLSDLSDLDEDADEAKESVVGVDSEKRSSQYSRMSEEGGDEARRFTKAMDPLVRIVEPNQTVGESNQISSDYESAVKLAAQVELRRSARNIARNNRAKTVNYVDFPRPRKSSFSKKKPAFEDEVVLQASFPCLSIREMAINVI